MDWQTKLVDAGYRHSRPRGVVMQILEKSITPLSANDILKQAKREGHYLGLASVYRALELLTGLDITRLVHTSAGCHEYALASTGHRHYILCANCDQVMEFDGYEDIDGLIDRVEGQTGFKVQKHLLQLTGLCAHCQAHGVSH